MSLPPSKIFSEYPPGIRMTLLMNHDNPSGDYFRDVVPYTNEAHKIENVIVERNLQGKELEKQQLVDEAIKLYEANISDLADTPHPYERLRIIYTKRKQYDDAIRACQAYIDAGKQLEQAILKEYKNNDLAQQYGAPGNFPAHIEKLQRLKNRNSDGFIEPVASKPIPIAANTPEKPATRWSSRKIIGITLGALITGICACVAFGWILTLIFPSTP